MSRKFTMLVVDDEPNILKAIKRLFVGTDYKIITAESGKAGLEVFEEHEIDIVISDYRMPDMNGVEFLRKIKEEHPDTIRIILSGFADVAAVVEAINDGQIYRFISKPWNDQELVTSIMRASEQLQLQKENTKLYTELQSRNKELQELADSLEEKVLQRTHDLEIKNRALKISQNILNLLPVGVLGIDSDGVVVYMNAALKNYINISLIGLGSFANGTIDEKLLSTLQETIKSGDPGIAEINNQEKMLMISVPLPEKMGVIGLFGHYGEVDQVYEKLNNHIKAAGVLNGG